MSEPRRINYVSILMLLAVAAGGYWLWKFFPVYYMGWQVDHLLAEAGTETYQIARLPDPARATRKAEIEAATRARVVALGVDDPDMTLSIDLTPQTATVSCDYSSVVKHPVASKQTVIVMHRQSVTDVKRVEW